MTGTYIAGRKVFVDTGAWIALAVVRDEYHKRARAIFELIVAGGLKQVTSNLIISETYTFLRYHIDYRAAMRFLESIKEAETMGFLHLIYSTPAIEKKAALLLKKYHDQLISYVDAVSFAILEQHSDIQDVFTFDGHFYLISKNVIRA